REKKGWFESKDGPRGWIIGQILCLWLSALNSHGPMVIALLKNDDRGTRIIGRAGADLNGTALFLLLTPLMAWISWQMYLHSQGTIGAYIAIGIIFGFALPLTLWINSRDRRDADPLVSFLRRVTKDSRDNLTQTEVLSEKRYPIMVETADRRHASAISDKELFEALESLTNGDFIVLAKEDEHYMQILLTRCCFVVEKREGGPSAHFRTEIATGKNDGSTEYDVSVRRAFEILSKFVKGQQPNRDLSWKRVEV
ncbi:MAG TPA: hypothetical protein VFV06_08495, partial [Sphingorhabdus sp.]|nr:hypothetical protein [Sphingorhabdus sp.]